MAMLIIAKLFSNSDTSPNVNLNVFGYRSNIAVIDELNAFCDAFLAQVLPKIIAVEHINQYNTLLAAQEANGTGFVNRTIASGPGEGLRTGEPMPRFVAWGLRLNRATLGKRSGSKRFGLISEADVSSGSATSTIQALLDTLATQLAAPLTVGIIQTWFPVILERPVAPSTTWADHPVASAQYLRVTSQNTRKR